MEKFDAFMLGIAAAFVTALFCLFLGGMINSCMDDKIRDYHRTYHIKPVETK